MHPLRFPNSGIRAKIFVRKIGFRLRVMRLNHVESFYAFLLRFHSEGNKEEGQQGMARPPAWGWALQQRPPCKATVDCGQAPCKERLPVEAAACKGWPPAGAVAAREHNQPRPARKGRLLATLPQGRRRQPQGWPSLSRAIAVRKGKPLPA
ncbi:hypothetical protein BHE74_00009856 [Ensete ventricosum]|nr:hypothetical protein BHE74_00009856 [Ensete ventricosum]RZS04877.1 hypothetical protein BHM03_00035275 [Ensete ventricosum]